MIFNRKKEASTPLSSVLLGRFQSPSGNEVFAHLESRKVEPSTDAGWILMYYMAGAPKSVELGEVSSTQDAIDLLASFGYSFLSEH